MTEQTEPPRKEREPFLTESLRRARAAALGAVLGVVLALVGRRR
jgi:hypothetical protein